MKKTAVRKLLVLVPILFSCGSSPINPNSPVVFRNGDLIGVSEYTYSSTCIYDNGDRVIERLRDGETVYLVIAAGDCGHCQELEPKFAKAIMETKIEAYMIHAETLSTSSFVTEALNKIEMEFPSLKGVFTTKFPYSFRISKESFQIMPFTGHSATSSAVVSYINENMHHGDLVRFHDSSKFTSYLGEKKNKGYVYSNSLKTFNDKYRDNIKGEFALLENYDLEEGFYENKDGALIKVSENA